MKTNKNKPYSKKKFSTQENDVDFVSIYVHFIYRYLGRKLVKNDNFKNFFQKKVYNKKYESILRKANLKIMPEEYFISIYITLIISMLLVIIIFAILILILKTRLSFVIFIGGLLAICFLGIFLYNYPIFITKSRGKEIDAAIPFLLPYLKILSKEINLAKIIEIIDSFLIYKEIRIEFKKIKYYSDFIGYDIHSSIRQAMQSCPSRQLSDLMNDLVTISNSGGSIYNYLDRKLHNLEMEIEALEKKNIETLLIFSQIYIVVLLISPLFFTIMAAILNLVQSGSDGGNPLSNSTVASIIFLLLILPIVYAGFMMLVYYSKPLYSRLKPMRNDEL
jgi:hypothetical protein